MKNILTVIVIFLSLNINAQELSNYSLDDVPSIKMEPVNNEQLMAEEVAQRSDDRAPRFAVSFDVNIDPFKDGIWVEDGDISIWRIIIESKRAKSLNFGFSSYNMPDGGKLFLYSYDKKLIRGPFSPADNEEHNQLWTPVIKSDKVVIEVQIPTANKNRLDLLLTSINHDFMGFGEILSGSCNLDVICTESDGWGIVDGYRDIIQSVAVIGLDGNTFCTGFLVNTTDNDCKPMFMTANHCGINSGNAASFVAYWNFQNSYCRQPDSPESGSFGDGTLDDFNTGAYHRASFAQSDFTIIELDDPVSETANAFFAGWNATNILTSGIGIHHPNTDEKRISFENEQLSFSDYFGESGDSSHVQVEDWDIGTTEPGSSGSPLFDSNKRVVGQLHGGSAACGNDLSDYYGSLHMSWEGGGTSGSRLKDWLDPGNTGILEMDGRWASACSYNIDVDEQNVSFCTDGENSVSHLFHLFVSDNFESNVALTLPVSPSEVDAVFSASSVPPGATVDLIVTGIENLETGTYNFTVNGVDANGNEAELQLTLIITASTPLIPIINSPANGAVEVSIYTDFSWAAQDGEVFYNFTLSTDSDFNDIILSVDNYSGTILNSDFALEGSTTYYWKVNAVNTCGMSTETSSSFTTEEVYCQYSSAEDIPIAITDLDTIFSTISVDEEGVITSISLKNIKGTHTYLGDLTFWLESPSGTQIILVNAICGDEEDFDFSLSDLSEDILPCPYNDGGTYLPYNSFSAFNGEEAIGDWTMIIFDAASFDQGELEGWDIEVCTDGPSGPDFSIIPSVESIELCINDPYEFEIQLGTGYENEISLSYSGYEGVSLSTDTANQGDVVTVYIEEATATGDFTLIINATDGVNSNSINLPITILPLTPHPEGLGVTLDGLIPTFTWNSDSFDGNSYLTLATDELMTEVVFQGEVDGGIYEYTNTQLNYETTYYWNVYFSTECGDNYSDLGTFTTGVNGVYSLKNSTIFVYPNPVTDKLNIHFTGMTDEVKVHLTDVNGRKVFSNYYYQKSNIEIPLSNISTGVYFLKIENSKNHLIMRVVKE